MNELLAPDDPKPVQFTGNALAPGPFLLLGDHAGRAVPAALGGLGLPPEELDRHIAWDLGSRQLGEALAARLEASFVSQAYSRLVIDCNRDPADPSAIAAVSDAVRVAGNEGLSEAARRARVDAVFEPYHAAIAALLDARAAARLETVLVSVHSFTPVMDGFERPWEVGVLHDGRRDEFALAVLEALRRDARFRVGDNEPYDMDETDYTIPCHAYPRELPYLELEVRQDLIGPRCDELAEYLAGVLAGALADCAES